ncbi:LPXTG cell wall anchor domain-containing protein [Actinoplanes oblitus]|uniref:LPXTG cell wall anchor domain-containing protein n=1 Tax=Actinoplanes oblitus TaxID=3040509 RepID=A0ABY8WEJ7_9ACTN|nr:LPXTG cell wall anchor domain-containing protein [Actinoplanes oblitus]WIM95493.1 LPXTG cell wall anchor domain-containing protein [Actinoplanes oblitus]
MKLSKSPLRRVATVAAGAALGLGGLAVFAAPASAHHSDIEAGTTCDTETGNWTVKWTVFGYAPEGVPTYHFETLETAAIGGKAGELVGLHKGEEYKTNTPTEGTQALSADVTSITLTETVRFSNNVGDTIHTKTVSRPEDCKKVEETKSPSPTPTTTAPSSPTVTPSTTASAPEEPLPDDLPGEPTPIYKVTCDSMTFGFDNPADGVEIKLHFKPSSGAEKDLVIAPGEKKSITLDAKAGFTVDVTITLNYKGKTYTDTETVKFDDEAPADCDKDSLPVTGAAAGSIAGGAAVLLIGGGALFVMARRRKLRFTA